MGKTEWAEMEFIDGRVTYGLGGSADDTISLACILSGHDFYPTQPEIIALSRLLDTEMASRIGLGARLPHVLVNLETAMGNALLPLIR